MKTNNSSKKADQSINLPKFEKLSLIDFAENINPFGPSERVKLALERSVQYLNIYPDWTNNAVNKEIAQFFQVPIENVTVTCGSMEPIFSLPKLLNLEKSALLSPSFWGYEGILNDLGIQYERLNTKVGTDLDIQSFHQVAARSSILFFCNPNNPTLTYVERDILLEVIRKNRDCHFIIDESPLMFSKDFQKESLCTYVCELDNLSLVYSFSKFFSIAGIRVGGLLSNAEMIKRYKRNRIPYSVGSIVQALLPVCLTDLEFVEQSRCEITDLLIEFANELRQFPWLDVYNGKTNFILCKITNGILALNFTERLKQDGFYVRELVSSYPELGGEWIRFSVNTRENNRLLIEKIKSYNII